VFFDISFPINPILMLSRDLYYWNWPIFPGRESYAGAYFYMLGTASFFQLLGSRIDVLQYFSLLIITFISSSGFYLLVKFLLEGVSTNNMNINLSALVSGIFFVVPILHS